MNRRSIITRFDYEEYLVRLTFRTEQGYVASCVERAYRDIRRTFHGLTKIARADDLIDDVSDLLRRLIEDLVAGNVAPATQDEFDGWHHAACEGLLVVFGQYEYDGCYLGQVQRWLNMALKYAYALGDDRVPGLGPLYLFCHVPLDMSIVTSLADYGSPTLSVVWSRLTDYDEYLRYQQWVRRRFALVPLDVDIMISLGRDPEGRLIG